MEKLNADIVIQIKIRNDDQGSENVGKYDQYYSEVSKEKYLNPNSRNVYKFYN